MSEPTSLPSPPPSLPSPPKKVRVLRWRFQTQTVLVVACVCALLALALMTWQLFQPKAFPIIVAMSVGQVLGTASFVAFLVVVLADLRKQRRELRVARASGVVGASAEE